MLSTSFQKPVRYSQLVALMIVTAAFSRIIPHMPNFSPLGAIALFGAAYFPKKWQAFFVPLTATWLSDLFINNVLYARYYPSFTWFYDGWYWQYGSYALITLAGFFIFKKINAPRVLLGAVSSSALFFLLSNFGCWPGSSYYSQDLSGLLACYAAGLPFLKGTVMGDLFYCTVLFGSFAWAQKQFPSLRPHKLTV